MAAFDDVVSIDTVDIRFEYPWEKYFMKVETSIDGNDWVMVADYTTDGISGSPVNTPVAGKYKFVRFSFITSRGNVKPSVWEVCFY